MAGGELMVARQGARFARSTGAIAEAIVFSKDRPLQLGGLLESLRRHCVDASDLRIRVLYFASTSFMRNLYSVLASEHDDVDFVQEHDFKRDVESITQGASVLLFLVDDAIITGPVSIQEIAGALDRQQAALGFSLRLGRNTTYCYPLDREQALPRFSPEPGRESILSYEWRLGEGDFGYPLEVSSSAYRAAQLVPVIKRLRFTNPNTLEAALAKSANGFGSSHPLLMCYATSAAFCAPVNLVQTAIANRAGVNADMSVEALAQAFYRGHRLDVDEFSGFVPRAAHQEVELRLRAPESTRPKVSVVIPCYGQAEFLDQAIESVVSQTLADWELIVVNDGSPDDTSLVAQRAQARHPDLRISLIETDNRGVASARNTGIAASTGWMILPLDADDMIDDRMLATTVAALEADWRPAIAYTDYRSFGVIEELVLLNEYDLERLCLQNQMSYCSLFRRHAWEDAGGYNPNMVWGNEDWDFWVSCGDVKAFGTHVAEPLLHYRTRSATRSATASRHAHELEAIMRANHPSLYTLRRRLIRSVIVRVRVAYSRVLRARRGFRSLQRRGPDLEPAQSTHKPGPSGTTSDDG